MTRRALLLLLVAGLLLLGGKRRGEYELKAAFLYQFAKGVTWPEAAFAGSPSFTIGVLGEDPFEEDLEETVGGKSIGNRPIVFERFAELALLRPCQLLFVAESEADEVAEVVAKLRGLAVLTVGDEEDLARRGLMVSFKTESRKVRFEMNVAAIRAAGLEVSADLVDAATVVGSP